MIWMMIILAAQTVLVIAVVIWLHLIRRRARDLAAEVARCAAATQLAEERLLAAIERQNKLGVRLFRWRDHFKRIAAQETPTANATVRRMARMARELPAGPGRR